MLTDSITTNVLLLEGREEHVVYKLLNTHHALCYFVLYRNEDIELCCLWLSCSPGQLELVCPVMQLLWAGMTGVCQTKQCC